MTPDAPDPHGWAWALLNILCALAAIGLVIFVAVTTTGPLQ